VSRRIKLPTREMGEIKLVLIDEIDGKWEPEWEPLRGTIFGDQFSRISKEVLDHALHRWSKPLAQALGIPPDGAIRKVLPVSSECYRKKSCQLYIEKNCHPLAKNMPWCFEPTGVSEEVVRLTATQALTEWRDHVHLVVIQNEEICQK